MFRNRNFPRKNPYLVPGLAIIFTPQDTASVNEKLVLRTHGQAFVLFLHSMLNPRLI